MGRGLVSGNTWFMDGRVLGCRKEGKCERGENTYRGKKYGCVKDRKRKEEIEEDGPGLS